MSTINHRLPGVSALPDTPAPNELYGPQAMHMAEKCVCGHRRDQHDFDADFDEGRWLALWGICEVSGCGEGTCEKFENEE